VYTHAEHGQKRCLHIKYDCNTTSGHTISSMQNVAKYVCTTEELWVRLVEAFYRAHTNVL